MDTNLVELMEKFNSEERCREYIEQLRWPSGTCCTRCGSTSVSRIKVRNQYECNYCRYQFSPMAGTVFHNTHLSLVKWFLAVYLMCESKKGMSANQISRTLKIGYKAAWYLCHRIREAMQCDESELLEGIVEADEMSAAGRYDKRRKREPHETPCIVGVIQRGGPVRARKAPSRGALAIAAFLRESVKPGSQLMTDEYAGYQKVGKEYEHRTVKHSALQYVDGPAHTNSIENFWSLFKRGVVGSFHKVSEKHLDRYLGEFVYRFNERQNGMLFAHTIRNLVNGKALPFKKLTKAA